MAPAYRLPARRPLMSVRPNEAPLPWLCMRTFTCDPAIRQEEKKRGATTLHVPCQADVPRPLREKGLGLFFEVGDSLPSAVARIAWVSPCAIPPMVPDKMSLNAEFPDALPSCSFFSGFIPPALVASLTLPRAPLCEDTSSKHLKD
jgi:hypothetical protein